MIHDILFSLYGNCRDKIRALVCYVDLSHPPVGATILIVCVLYCQNNYDDLYIV